MASIIRQRLRRFNGTDYDTIHLETEIAAMQERYYIMYVRSYGGNGESIDDTINLNGAFYISGYAKDVPSNASNGHLLSSFFNDTTAQIYIPYNSTNMYIRSGISTPSGKYGNNGILTRAWRKVAFAT